MDIKEALEGLSVPKHIAIIMDGNGRWAKKQGKKRAYGHKKGSDNLQDIARAASDMGVKYLTVYAFSTENWRRPDDEVSYLMMLLRQYLKDSIKKAKKDNMRVRVIGRKEDLELDIRSSIEELEEATADMTGLNLQIAINYGGRDEIVRGINQYMKDHGEEGLCNPITEAVFSTYLDTDTIPDPELMIRTSGEMRLSNFLIWQLAYAEFYFTQKHWPAFTKEDLLEAIGFFNKVDRRFGGLSDEN